MIVGLDHIQLAMPEGREDAARAFYADILELTETEKPKPLLSRGGCWFEGGGVMVHLGVEKDFAPARKAHPAFLVADLEMLRGLLEEAGIGITPDNALPGIRRFYAADPFGNRLEFIQSGDGFSEKEDSTK